MVEISKYKQMFVNETLEQISQINETVSVYQKNQNDSEAINTLFRGFHSIKGMAASMGYSEIQDISHKLEDLLDSIRNGTIKYQSEIINVLYEGSQLLEKQVNIVDSNSSEKADTASLFNNLGNILSPKEAPLVKQPPMPHPMQEEEPEDTDIINQDDLKLLQKGGENYFHIKIKISAESISPPARAYLIIESLKVKESRIITIPAAEEIEAGKIELDFEIFLGTNLNQSEVDTILKSSVEIENVNLTKLDLVSAAREGDPEKLIVRNFKTENAPVKIEYRKPSAVKVETYTLNNLIDLVGEMFIQENQLMDIAKSQESPALIESINRLEKLVRKLYKEIMTLRLIPLSMLSDVIPRVIREVLKDTKKSVDLEVTGKEIKLDRAIVEKLGDPLIHLVRNCLDHGIEQPDDRIKKGKPEIGKLTFSASKKKENIIIELSDDGKGLDPKAIRKKIAVMGLLSAEELNGKSDEEVYNYIWLPGFSTASTITTVSGRGVGMDIVKNVVEGVGGKVWANSKIDEGCKFYIQVPLTMAIIKTFRITLNDELFAIPLNQVIRTLDMPVSDIRREDDQKFFFEFQEKEIELFDLKELFNYGSIWNNAKKTIPVLVVETDRGVIGLMVDSFLSGYETVTKPLGLPLEKLEFISGASLSEKGDVILLIDVEKIIQRDRPNLVH